MNIERHDVIVNMLSRANDSLAELFAEWIAYKRVGWEKLQYTDKHGKKRWRYREKKSTAPKAKLSPKTKAEQKKAKSLSVAALRKRLGMDNPTAEQTTGGLGSVINREDFKHPTSGKTSLQVEKPAGDVKKKPSDYEDFKTKYKAAWDKSVKYKMGTIGNDEAIAEMSDLAEKYPDYEETYNQELESEQQNEKEKRTNTVGGERSNSDQERIQSGKPMGEDAPKSSDKILPKNGSGDGAGPKELPDNKNIGSLRAGDIDGESGSESRIGEGDSDRLPSPEASGGRAESKDLGDDGSDEQRRGSGEKEASTVNSSANFRYKGHDFGGLKQKYKNNLAAIRTLKNIETEGRAAATPEEQEILSKYVGWGQFPAIFNPYDQDLVRERNEMRGKLSDAEWKERYDSNSWRDEQSELRDMMTDDEWRKARESTLNAHYTHPDIVKAHWDIAKKLGFNGGKFLETSAGIGYYLGMMPSDLAGKTKIAAVEQDSLTGRMLKLLYPEANIQNRGFETFKTPDNFYDLVASNVPFGTYKLHDEKYNKFGANIHDYFFLKSVDLAAPGGLVMHITSTGTLDNKDSKIRKALAEKCDLVAAIRMPDSAHKKNAGTSVVTDLIILRKKRPEDGAENLEQTPKEAEPKKPGFTGITVDSIGRLYHWVDGKRVPGPKWDDVVDVKDPDGKDPIPVNRYFAEHPEQILGRLDRSGSMYRGESKNVSVKSPEEFQEKLQAAIERIPGGVFKEFKAPKKRFEPEVMPAPGETKDGGYAVKNGKLFQNENGMLVEQKAGKDEIERIKDHLILRDAVREVINEQIRGNYPEILKDKLNRSYDAFVKKHGFLNDKKNKNSFRGDPDSPLMLALENWDSESNKATRADIFHKNTIRPFNKADKASSVSEAVGILLNEEGKIDINRISKLIGKSAIEVSDELVESGLAFKDPSSGWQPANQYLSGNVRQKLIIAKSAAETDPYFKKNVEALEKVQPDDVEYSDISVKMGVPWIPPSDISNFAGQLLGGDSSDFAIFYNPLSGKWVADFSSRGKKWLAHRDQAKNVWATPDTTFDYLLEHALNGTQAVITRKDSDGNSHVDVTATADANAKIDEMNEAFKNWLWEDDERRDRLHRYYNDNYNNIRPIDYDGSHLSFPGMNPAINLRDHQKDFAWQVITTGKGLAAHEVGTGKTYTMIASAMELRRLGLAKKPCIACLKANVDAITADARRLYPGAKILSTTDMFDAANRKKTISKIATGDYDMVIMTHDHLDLLKMKPEVHEQYVQEEIDELDAAIRLSNADNPKKGNRIVKQLEKAKKNLEAKLKEALEDKDKDNAVYFEETGIDQLFVDEAHKYKSLPVITSQRGLKGVPNTRSDRATNMQMRTRWLQERNGGRGVVFATGTPVANTMAELYNIQKYLQPEELKQRGVYSFDAWAKTFGSIQTKPEFSVAGEYKPVSRFSQFVNIPELMQTVRQVMDVQKADLLVNKDGKKEVNRPKRKDNVVIAPKNTAMQLHMKSLQDRAKKIKGQRAEPGSDNMLTICNDGRKAALDMRMVDANAEDHPDSKANLCVRNVLEIHKKNPGKTQLIFSDVGVNPMENGFHLYKDVIDKLVAGGIPRSKIADFSSLTDAKKEAVMEKMRKGDILVGIGSTDKLGTGVNVQDHLSDLHHLDVPYLPASVEQRDGRGWRQGNKNEQVNIHRYVSEGSLDQTFWQIVGNKTKFIKQVITPGASISRVAKEEDSEEISPEQLMAAASGDPRILEKVNLDEDVKNLRAGQDRHNRGIAKLKRTISNAEQNIPELEKIASRYKKHLDHLEANKNFHLEFDGNTHTERNKEITESLDKALQDSNIWSHRPVAKYRGLDVKKRGNEIRIHAPGDAEGVPVGSSLGSIEYVARNMGKRYEDAMIDVQKSREDIEKMKGGLDKTYLKETELTSKLKRLNDLNEELKKENNLKPSSKPESV